MIMRKKSHLLLSHKRMNRYLLDVGLCKHKKNLWEKIIQFFVLTKREISIYTQIEQSSQMGEIDERMRLFPLAIVFLTPFV